MSKFVEALEHAARERTLGQSADGSSSAAPVAPAPVEVGASPDPLPVTELPHGLLALDEHLVSLLKPTSFEAEQYRALRHLIEHLHRTAELSVVAVSSPVADDGKTTTAINLAGALAQDPQARVLLLDADLRRGALEHRLGLREPSPLGFVDVILDGKLTLEAVVKRCPPFNLSIVPAGLLPSAPYEVLKASRVGELLAAARHEYDFIVLDTSPLVSVPDCRVIEKWVDGFLVVVAAHKTPRKLLEEALNVTDPTKIVGLVFNGDERPLAGYSHGYGHSTNGSTAGWKFFGRGRSAARA